MAGANAVLTLEKITASNFDAALALKTKPTQAKFCPDNAYSLVQAQFHKGTYRRLICADGVPVGFVMLYVAKAKSEGEIYLWRFLMDGKSQGRGYGAKAFDLLMRRIVKAWPSVTIIKSCFIRGRGGPEKFWLRRGFKIDGPPVGDEVPMSLNVKTWRGSHG